MPLTEYTEKWKPVHGYEGIYEVSTLGNIRNVKSMRLLKKENGACGGPLERTIKLSRDSGAIRFQVHTLVVQAFGGEYDARLKEVENNIDIWHEINFPPEHRSMSQPKDREIDKFLLSIRPHSRTRRIYHRQYNRRRVSLCALMRRRPKMIEKLAYYGWSCRYCRRPFSAEVKLTWDHAIPFSRGGTEMLSNLLPACKSCNSRKHDKNIFEFLRAKLELL